MPVVTIPCDNDIDTKQGSTTATMARLGTAILFGSVFSPKSHGEMAKLLKDSSSGPDSSYFTRAGNTTNTLSGSQVTHGKIGYGNLKSKRIIFSDLNAIADPVGNGGRFIACYSNVDYDPYSIDDVLRVFLVAVRAYQSGCAAVAPAAAAAAAAAARVTR
jgi:hypothetical protein